MSRMDGGHATLCPPSYEGFRVKHADLGLDVIFLHSVERRRAEPCVAQRAAAVGALRNWLPAIYAASHCITSYPVGRLQPGTHIPHACGEEAMRMRPIYEAAC
jgi:hypothetical protein